MRSTTLASSLSRSYHIFAPSRFASIRPTLLSAPRCSTRLYSSDNMVKQIESYDEFKALINGDKPVIVDFWATWCGPCKLIGPHFDKLAPKFENVEFVKVDVDAQEEIAKEANIKAMPTFIAWKKGERIGDLTGAVPAKLVALVEKVASESA